MATVDATGLVTGVSQGTAIISYVVTNANGCVGKDTAKVTITLTPTVSPITTTALSFDVCVGSIIPLKDATAGGVWSSGDGSIATISSTGVVTGVSAGTDSIFYTITTTCLQVVADTVIITVHALPTAFNVTGGGAYCSGGSGVDISLSGSESGVNYQLYKGATAVGSPVVGTGSAISFGNQTAAGTYTVVATNATGCTGNMTGSVTVSINPLPATFAVTGGGAYCSGGSGVLIGLSGSQSGVSYQLYNGASAVGIPVSGTGSGISFGNQTAAGTYTVVATNTTTSCTNNMTGNVTIAVSPLPLTFNVTGGGAYCVGGSGLAIGLSGTELGVNYQLYNGASALGSPVSGNGSAISFGNQTAAGVYTVVGTNTSTGCTANMNGSVMISISPLPTAFNVTGGGSYCSGGLGVPVGLSGSESGVNYQLYNGASAVGTPVSGTGSAISFGNQTAAGTYTVVATNNSTSCTNNMTGSVMVTINPLPTAALSGSAPICVGGSAALTLTVTGSGTISGTLSPGAIPFSGTAPTITVNVSPASTTTYTIASLNDGLGCAGTTSGSATVTVNSPTPITNIAATPSTICLGSSSNLTASVVSTLLSEDFENTLSFTVATPSPPTSDNPATSKWIKQNGTITYNGSVVVTIGNGSKFMLTVSDRLPKSTSNRINTTLTSPTVSTVGYSSLIFSYKTYYRRDFLADDDVVVEVSTNGTSWTSVQNLYTGGTTGAPTSFASKSIDLSSYINKPNFQIRLRYNSNNGYFWAVDDISLTGVNASGNYSWTASPAAGAGLPAGAGTPSTANASIIVTPILANTYTYTATLINASGCTSTKDVSLTVNPTPVVTITADYCAVAGKVRLTATSIPAATSYTWSTGQTGSTIDVDIAGDYQAYGTLGTCTGTGTIAVAQELVTNGDFEVGGLSPQTNAGFGFTSDYAFHPDLTGCQQ